MPYDDDGPGWLYWYREDHDFPEDDAEDDEDDADEHPSLTAAERNPLMVRGYF